MDQLDFFGTDDIGAATTPEAAIMSALTRGDLAAVVAILDPLTFTETRDTCLKAGFSLSFTKSKTGLLRDIEPQILRACRECKTGFDLRDNKIF